MLWQIMCFWTKKSKTTTNTKQKIKPKTLVGAGNWTRDLSHPKRMRYHCTAESTESNDSRQAIQLFRRNGSKRK